MRNFLLASVTAAAVSFASASADATLSLSGGIVGTIPGTVAVANDLLAPLGLPNPSMTGHYGAQVFSTAGTLTFEFIGFEAGADNRFEVTGGGSFSTAAIPGSFAVNAAGLAPSFSVDFAGGLLPFLFSTTYGSGGSVTNGANPLEDPSVPAQSNLNFFATFAPVGGEGTSGDTLYLFFDDRGSTRPNPNGPGTIADDDNHDDMLIKITFTPAAVPEPATLALFGAGLLGLGMARRARRMQHAAWWENCRNG